jgi:tripeptidyl-peptidase I
MKPSAILGVVASVLLSFASSKHIVVESLSQVPDGWNHVRAVEPEQLLRLSVALNQPEPEILERVLYEVSDPGHPKYGNYYKRDELAELVKPLEESATSVLRWLQGAGIEASDIENAGQWLHFRITVKRAEYLLNTQFAVYARNDNDGKAIRVLEYSVPEEVHCHIATIQPTTYFSTTKTIRSTTTTKEEGKGREKKRQGATFDAPLNSTLNLGQCKTEITPACLRALYEVCDYVAVPTQNSLFGIVGFLEVSLRHSHCMLLQCWQMSLRGNTTNLKYKD